MPQTMGIVVHPYFLSPIISSISFTASRISDITKAKPAYKIPNLKILELMKYRVIKPILTNARYILGGIEEKFVAIGEILDSNNPDDSQIIKEYPSRVELIELPEKWLCEVTKDNIEMLDEWRKANAKSYVRYMLCSGYLVLSKHHFDDSLFLANSKSYMMRTHTHYYKDYTELTTEEFRKLVYEPFKAAQKPKLPDYWFFVPTEYSRKEALEWIGRGNDWHYNILASNFSVLSDGSCHGGYISKEALIRNIHAPYKNTELTEHQFLTLVYEPFKQQQKMNQNQETHKIDFGKLIEIRNLACSEWKQKISKEYIPRVNEFEEVIVTNKEVEEAFEAAKSTPEIKAILESVFGNRSAIDFDKLKAGSVVMIEHTVNHIGGVHEFDLSKPVQILFYKTKCGFDWNGEYFEKGRYKSQTSFVQKGKVCCFASHEEIDCITKVIKY